MLTALQIHNFVTIESLEIDFSNGMTTLTGETGAGKSILVDALGLVLGDKADSSLIRSQCERAEITAQFTLPDVEMATWLEQQEIPTDEGECIIRRVLNSNGRSKAYINGSMVTLALLDDFGSRLIDIHGQHAHQSLGSRQHQRQLLDGFAAHDKLCKAVESAWQEWLTTKDKLQELSDQQNEHRDQLRLLQFQLQELDGLSPIDGEWHELEQQQKRLANAQTLIRTADEITQQLYAGSGAEEQLQNADNRLGELVELDPSLAESHAMIKSALIEIQEASSGLQGYAGTVELDPQLLAEVDERLGNYHSLAKKYQCDPDQLAGLQEGLKTQLASLENADETLEALQQQLDKAEQTWKSAAQKLAKSRQKAAKKLQQDVTEQIQQLSMPHGEFQVALHPAKSEEPLRYGQETVEFLISANPGMAPQPISKVASGGELSRISLAIQVVTAGIGKIETLIFDEVDVGIGGATAEVVGQLLRQIASKRQILCVTHLPQVASQAHQHLRVEKESSKSGTSSTVVALDEEQRVQEIARMLGGVEMTERTLDHAAEMVSRGNQLR
ncbi:DNA repair protein RecN [Solemya velum gill symbiont]|uniref:DNA repair protein RecN n=1 Tax=Solemya velum gill symbiont TaxID=2340 RepID=UPI000997A7DC|nr:DNA repair protein RecN [Solemya velum gill symbiont]OOZ13358.1 DNA repair protein RecN [Solemya velum gill symbiont]